MSQRRQSAGVIRFLGAKKEKKEKEEKEKEALQLLGPSCPEHILCKYHHHGTSSPVLPEAYHLLAGESAVQYA